MSELRPWSPTRYGLIGAAEFAFNRFDEVLIMCGRITATFEFSEIRVRWNLDRDLPPYKPRFNVAPETSQHSRHCPAQGRQRVQAHAVGVDSELGRRPEHRQSYD